MSGSTAANRPPAAMVIGTRQPAAAAPSAVPSSPMGVTTSVGFSSPARPRTSLATTTCRPRMSVPVPLTKAMARLSASPTSAAPGIRQASAGAAIRTREGAATPSQGATRRAADTTRLFGAASS